MFRNAGINANYLNWIYFFRSQSFAIVKDINLSTNARVLVNGSKYWLHLVHEVQIWFIDSEDYIGVEE